MLYLKMPKGWLRRVWIKATCVKLVNDNGTWWFSKDGAVYRE